MPGAAPERFRCTATSQQAGRRCQSYAMRGLTVCRMHGGSASHARTAGQRRHAEQKAEQQARQALHRLDTLLGPAEPVDNPLRELQSLAGEAKRWKELMATRVAELTSVGYKGMTGEQVKAEVALYEKAMDRLATFLIAMGRMDIDARLAAINERQADAIIAALDAGLDAVHVPREERPIAKQAAARRLKAV